MMRNLLLYVLISFSWTVALCQKSPSVAAVQDFSFQAYRNFRFGTDHFRAIVYRTFYSKGYSIPDIAVAMERLHKDKAGRELLLKGLYDQLGGGDGTFLFQNLHSLGMTAAHAKELMHYLMAKYRGKVEGEKQEETTFFQGTKKFTDGDGWIYEVTIVKDRITIKLFPSESNQFHKEKKKPKEVHTGYVKGGKIYIKWKGKYDSSSYKFENGSFYQMNNEGGWNDYTEQ